MASAFNPYSQWLGIETNELPPNHYKLLRVTPFEADPQAIAMAAGAAMAKIRAIRPGSQAAEWQRLLDELAAAKKCLCEPIAKARYDEALRRRASQPAAIRATKPAAAPGAVKPSAPGGTAPKTPVAGSAPARPLPRAIPLPDSPATQQPISTLVTSRGAGGVPRTPAMPRLGPAVPLPTPGAVSGFPAAGLTMPNVVAGCFPKPFPTATPNPEVTPTVPSGPSAGGTGNQFFDHLMEEPPSPLDELGLGGGPRASVQAPDSTGAESIDGPQFRSMKQTATKRGSSRFTLIAVGVALVVALIIGAVMIAKSKRDADDAVAKMTSTSSTSDEKPNPLARDPNAKAQPPMTGSTKPIPSTDPPSVAVATVPAPAAQNPILKPAPLPEPPKPMPVDPAQAAKLRRTLADARVKLGERKLAEAKTLIAAARQLAATPEQHDMVDRVDSLDKYVDGFWDAVRDAVKALKPADEIDIGTTKVIVVESSAGALTIHMSGANRRFQVNQIPSGLAVALAQRWLDPKKPENKVFVGAFYLVDPKTGPGYAKQAWDEAAMAGVDVKNLLPLLQPDAPPGP